MIKKMFLFVFGLMATASITIAQIQVTGKVTDDKNNPIAKATVAEKGQKNAVTTDENGNFSIKIKSLSAILIFTHIGYEKFELKQITNNMVLTLKKSSEDLSEVVVTGYSIEKKSKYSGASTLISAKSIEDVPNGSFAQSLQGRLPGTVINSGSGQPGSSPRVQIRGISSISGAFVQPLYIVDGIPYNSTDFQSLNSNDFEDITLLKDADATALYGSRGANGVIVITTKRGKTGELKVTLRSQLGVTEKPDFSRLNLMNSAEHLQYEERIKLAGSPGWTYSLNNPSNASLAQNVKDSFSNILNNLASSNVDFNSLFYRNGISSNNDIQFSGGNDKTKFFTSIGYFNQDGIDNKSYLKRYSTRFNLDHTENKVVLNLNSLISYADQGLADGEYRGNSALNPFQLTYRALPYQNPYKLDGSIDFGANSQLKPRQVANSLEARDNTVQYYRQFKINTSFAFTYKFTKDIYIKNTAGVDYANNIALRFINPNSYIGSLTLPANSGRDQESSATYAQLINTTNLGYSKNFNENNYLSANVFFEMIKGYNKTLGFDVYNLDKRITESAAGAGSIPAGSTPNYTNVASSYKSSFGIRSFFGNVKYTYKDRYTFSGTIREDGTSRILKSENKKIYSWATGFVWNVNKENFIKNIDFINELKLRTSYGITPNIGAITASLLQDASFLNFIPIYLGGQLPSFGTNSYLGSTITGISPINAGYEDLKIENVGQFNIGIDLSILKSRVKLTLDYYNRISRDLYVQQNLSSTSGFLNQNINAGVLSNKGLEITLNIDVVRSKDWTVNINWNHAININKIEDLNNPDPEYQYVLGTYLIKKGLPFGSHFTYDYRGADPATGKPRYRAASAYITDPITLKKSYNANGDTLVTDINKADQFATFGSWIPTNTGGLELKIKYKQFSLTTLFSYQYDVIRSNNIRNWITRGTPGYQGAVRGSKELLTNQWQNTGDQKWFQSPAYDRGFTSSDLEDASFIRLRNIDFSYNYIPKNTKHIKSIRFYVQAQNIAFWSKFSGLDPEDNNNISLNEYPNPKFYNFGLDINL